MTGKWGPDGCDAAVALTFDNLGEASDIEFSRWPAHEPVGQHHSVVQGLPAIVDLLGQVKATFFIEAWNLPIYPAQIQALSAAGHEIACHGLRHEIWSLLTPDQELDHITRCQHDFLDHGIEIRGLRPPGGVAARSSAELLPSVGLRYISPFSTLSGVLDTGLAVVQCNPAAADAGFYLRAFAPLRTHRPGEGTLSPDDFVEGVMSEIEGTVAAGGAMSILCHPHLQSRSGRLDPHRIEAITQIVQRIAGDKRIWVATCADIADWMLSRRDCFAGQLALDPPDGWDASAYQKPASKHAQRR